MFSMLETLEHISTHDVTLLFIGETGTGKTYLATLVHELSGRRNGRFLTTACGALPPDLIESELFGHVRGAFTSADRTKIGRFEAAEGGTLLLDEIDVLGAKEQVKLLRVIETGEYEPVGSAETKSSNVRLIVASNVDLKGLTEKDKFRSDLYYRLNVLEFHLLPLRERPMDLVPLAMEFLDESCDEHSIAVERVDVHFLRLLKHYHWPGNLRELKNQMRRAVLFSKNHLVTADVLSQALLSVPHDGTNGSSTSQLPGWNLNERMAQSEKEILEETLRAHNNNRTATARALGISRVGLYKKMRRFGLLPPKSTHMD
jgi:transcriptional regulator with PAS, ATPase and Fis domain